MAHMKFHLLAFLTFECLFAMAVAHAGEYFGMPLEMAREHAALVAGGAGVLFPGEAPVVESRDFIPYWEYDFDWPIGFRLGLKPRLDGDFIVYPVSVQLDDATGDAVFVNADGEEFYAAQP